MRERGRRLVLAGLLCLGFVAWSHAADFSLVAVSLLSRGIPPADVARQIIRQGVDPEDAAAAIFETRPNADTIRQVAYAAVEEGARANPDAAPLIAVGVASLEQPAALPAAIAVIVAAPKQTIPAAAAVAQNAPVTAPLIAAAIARMVPGMAVEASAAIAKSAPGQALFVTATVLHLIPRQRDELIETVERAIGARLELIRQRHEPTEWASGNAIREADEVLELLKLQPSRR
jgi:hypothetical protein